MTDDQRNLSALLFAGIDIEAARAQLLDLLSAWSEDRWAAGWIDGIDPLELLRRSVPGYVPANSPLLRERDQRFEPLPEF